MKIVLGAFFVIVSLAVPSYAQKKAPVLDKLIAEFETAFNAKDMAKLAAFYADDAVWLRPNAPLIRGRSALEAAFKKQFTGPAVLKLTPIESVITGNYGFSAGTYTVTVPVNGAGSRTLSAKYLTVFKRVAAEWKITYDMQNADQPPPPAR